jgi:hypothetical protein
MKKITLSVSVFFFTLLHPMLACVGCREPGVGNSDEPQTVLAGVGLSWGVLCMLSVVFVIVSALVVFIARTCRELDRQKPVQ